GEHQPKPVVADAAVIPWVPAGIVGRRQRGCLPQLDGLGRAAAQPVESPVARHGRQPGPGAARNALGGPGLQRLRERVLRALLGQVPVAGHPDQGGDDPSPFLAERLRDGGADVVGPAVAWTDKARTGVRCRQSVQNGLTSIVPPYLATGCFEATSIASSRSAHSITSNPAICSVVSANGPSATSTSPSRTRTVVASLTGRRPWPNRRTPRPSISSTQAWVELSSSACSSGVSSTDSSRQIISRYFMAPPRSRSSRRGSAAIAGARHPHDEREPPPWTTP